MSALQRSFARAKLAKLPAEVPMMEKEGEDSDEVRQPPRNEQDHDDGSSISSASSTGTIKPLSSKNLFSRPARARAGSYTESVWSDYFTQELYLTDRGGTPLVTHHAYLSPPTSSGPLFVMHHGAGSSGLSFAVCSAEIRQRLPDAGVLSLDARGHGETVVKGDDAGSRERSVDMSLQTLSQDLTNVILLTQKESKWLKTPDLVLVGHSLGGAVVTEVAKSGKLGDAVLAYSVLDVVEEYADISVLSSTPLPNFVKGYRMAVSDVSAGVLTAITDHSTSIRSRTIRDAKSACVSVPGLLQLAQNGKWIWRTDLAATQPFWEGWFVGLSSKFLSAKGGKLLLLAGTDRLDKELMIGQMQGKYQLQVFPEAGHFIHEDLPQRTAEILIDFYHRNDRSALVLPPKVGDLLKNQQELGAFAK